MLVLILFPLVLYAIRLESCDGFIVSRQRYQEHTLTTKSQRRHLSGEFWSRNVVVRSSENPNQDVLDKLESVAKKESFWNSQQKLATALSAQTKLSLRQEQSAKFERRRLALVVDTAYIAWFIFCACWMIFPSPMTAISYSFGATMGIAYTYGLGKSVEVIGKSIDDVGATQGAGVGEARFAFLILLFLFVGKFRGGEYGLQEIPSIAGFFTYQIASLNQGLREIND
jgi:hypothetical protein